MNQQQTLFTSYPQIPAHRQTDTSLEAAESIDAPRLREMALRTLSTGNYTADEVARINHHSVLSFRPRLSELRNLGKVVDTGMRRKNVSGKSAIVWRLI